MNVEQHEAYRKYQPEPGSKLHQFIIAELEAQHALGKITARAQELRANFEATTGRVNNPSMDAPTSDLVRERIRLEVLTGQLRDAEKKQRQQEHALRLAEQALATALVSMAGPAQFIHNIENGSIKMAFLGESDKRRLAEARQQLGHYEALYLVA